VNIDGIPIDPDRHTTPHTAPVAPLADQSSQANDLRAGIKVAKWRMFGHPKTLQRRPASLKWFYLTVFKIRIRQIRFKNLVFMVITNQIWFFEETKMIKLFFVLILLPSIALSTEKIGDDGLFKQDWFHQSFLEIGDDAIEAGKTGKYLMVLIEQAGCPYCRELHRVNFQNEKILKHLQDNFLVVQLDLWGSREVVGLDGESFEERNWVTKNNIFFTPTTLIYTATESGDVKEVFRMPGYLKPFHYLSSLEYVSTKKYLEKSFQHYLQEKFNVMRATGETLDVWQ
jgi:thioredoxin-related protein|tara:strand:- start:741 stop:1595 length:855 start_codon:yes stop_codon:yes gene_type:complete